ncbi:response regulator transcription factor [Lacihabitans lacunae]|uniref:Response regulator transcription factor n=1 Tax=Lacihabitans lacunae TaxID=1028214 RepID=A0ABV7Z0G8_9BACT
MKRILLVEDDLQVCGVVKRGLQEENYVVEVANDGEKGLYMFTINDYDILILDIMLPKISGLELCVEIRKKSQVPILLLTALGTAENVAEGLNKGADDYLVKPFKFIELNARINSLLRRANLNSLDDQKEILTFSVISLDDTAKTVFVGKNEVTLTTTEYNLLKLFMKMPNKVFSRQQILEDVWGINFDLSTNVVDVYINYLRKKLDKQGCPKVIQTVVGMGYTLRENNVNSK